MRTFLILLMALIIAAAQSLPASAAVSMGDVPGQALDMPGQQAELCVTANPEKPAPALAYRHCAKGQAKHSVLPCDPVRGVLAESSLRLPPDIRQDVEHRSLPRMHTLSIDTFLRPPRLRT